MGGHNDAARALDAHRLGRLGRVRARPDTRPHRRGTRARQGARRPYGATPCPHAPSARGSLARPCQGQGDAGRLGAALQCVAEYDFEAVAMNDDDIDYRRLAELYEEFDELWTRLHACYLDAVAGFRFVASYVQSE